LCDKRETVRTGMRRTVSSVLFAVFACLSTWSRASFAALNLGVERGPGAEDCPETAALAAQIARIRGRDDTHATTVYVVGFKRTGTELSAVIRVGGTSVRVLSVRGQSCKAIAQAAAVTLAMLIDSDDSTPRPAVDKPKPPAETKPTLRSPAREVQDSHTDIAGGPAVGVAALVGVLGPIAPALSAEGELRVGRFRGGIGALWGLERTLPLGPGSVRESLIAGTFRGCLGITNDPALRLDLCAGLFGGVLGATAQGFDENLTHRRPWLVLPVELSLARLSGPIGWELSASALTVLVEHDFAIDGVSGVAYHAPPVAGMLSLRGLLVFPN
jgi:hypothetical protein